MAEYIDRQKLLELINEDCKYKKPTNEYTRGCNDVCEWAIKTIENIPTADVVPKSEVDDLKRYIILNEDIAIKCKQENGEQNEEYWKGKISAFRQILAYIDAELKKKYTERGDNK